MDEMEIRETIVPLKILADDIKGGTMLEPTAMMLPLSMATAFDTAFGIPVIAGDRAALIYEAPKGKENS